ncbi:YetF domain-containing protein, partial [Paenibacillus sp. TAF58]
DGKVQDENLEKIGKTRFWLKNQLQAKGVRDFKEVFYFSIDHRGRMFLDRKR